MVRNYAGVEMKTAVRNAVVDETIAGDPHASIEYLEPFANDRIVRPGILVCAPTRDFHGLIEGQARQRRPFFPGTPPVADYDFLGEPFQGISAQSFGRRSAAVRWSAQTMFASAVTRTKQRRSTI